MTSRLFWTGLAVLLAGAPTVQAAPASPFDLPLKTVKVPLPRDPDNPQSKPKVTCAYYRDFMVKEVDLGEEGADQLSILPAPAVTCQRANAKGEKVVSANDWSGYFAGVRGGYVVFTGDDGWNGGMGFAVFDAHSGRKLFDDAYKTRFKALEASSGGLVLHYRRVYAAKCSLRADPNGCWAAIRRDTGLEGVHGPDCAADYAREARRTPKLAAQVRAVPTVVDYDVMATLQSGHAAIHPAPGLAPTCHLAD